jgi:hypothetical protein
MIFVLKTAYVTDCNAIPDIPYTRRRELDENEINDMLYDIFAKYNVDDELIPYIVEQMQNNIVYDKRDEIDIVYFLTSTTSNGIDVSKNKKFRDMISIEKAFNNAQNDLNNVFDDKKDEEESEEIQSNSE